MPLAGLAPLSPREVRREFTNRLAHGARLVVQGTAGDDPEAFLRAGHYPRHRIELFGHVFYLGRPRQNPSLRFLVAWALPPGRPEKLHARIFYKDISLVWRSASHYVPEENWIGKGDVAVERDGGWERLVSVEETTDLPLEIQDALETLNHSDGPARTDHHSVGQVLRCGPVTRIAPYDDFAGPRRRAASVPANRVNGGRPIASFTRADDPSSLRFARGYEPDFDHGVLGMTTSTSRLYGGRVRRFRILSLNRRIQYLFFAGRRHVWIMPPQTLGTEIMSYGVRTITVTADERLCVPAFEWHYYEDGDDGPVLVSQIPEGYVGAPHPDDPARADARAWIDALPIVQAFRRKVLRQNARGRTTARRSRRTR